MLGTKWCKRCEDFTERNASRHCVPCTRTKSAAWTKANPDKNRINSAAWRKAHPATSRARIAAWTKANPDKHRAQSARRRALLISQRCTCCTDKQVADQYWLSDGEHMDHIKPLALGGLHCRFNLQQLSVPEHKEKTRADMAAIARARRALSKIPKARAVRVSH